ncbi:hypothetical protein TNCV_4879671 [Trichonephila clavipes]|nr:hypothetical protein TNCV_4879671 [Trichonephila clavipes]
MVAIRHNDKFALDSECRHVAASSSGEWYRYPDRGLPCHEFEPSTTKDPPCRAATHVKSVEELKRFPHVGVLVRRGGASSSVITSLDHSFIQIIPHPPLPQIQRAIGRKLPLIFSLDVEIYEDFFF